MILRSSQNGWPVSINRKAIGIRNYLVPGANRHFSCTQEAAPILIAFAAFYHRFIQKIDSGPYDDWGWAKPKLIPGQTVFSNHASGTAIDINATLHQWKAPKSGFSKLQEIRIRWKCRALGIRWGWDYRGGWKDPMHFEIIETPAQVKARIAKLKLPMPKEGTVG